MKRDALRQKLEVLLARLGLAIIPRIPRPGILSLARFLGAVAYAVSPHLRRVGLCNLELAFRGKFSPQQMKSILQKSFKSFALVMLDSFWFSRKTEERLRQYVKFDPGCALGFQQKAQICITAHLGNWEVLGMAFVHRGFPMLSVAAPLANPGIDALFNQLRQLTGQKVLSKRGAIRHLLTMLKDGGKIGLLLDQNTKPTEGGIFVEFFGLPVPVSSVAAALWQRTGAEIIFGACIPQPDGTYFVPAPEQVKIDEADPGGALESMTRQIAKATETWVRTYPEAWLWTYKRWKYVAPGRTREEYPFYAKTTFAGA